MNFKEQIANEIAKASGLEPATCLSLIELPPNPEMGDYAFPCFTLAKSLRKAPPLIANDF